MMMLSYTHHSLMSVKHEDEEGSWVAIDQSMCSAIFPCFYPLLQDARFPPSSSLANSFSDKLVKILSQWSFLKAKVFLMVFSNQSVFFG